VDKKIYIPDYASISPMGDNEKEVWSAYTTDQSCIDYVSFNGQRLAAGKLNERVEKQISELRSTQKALKKSDRTALLATHAALKLNKSLLKKGKSAIHIGSSRGATERLEAMHQQYMRDSFVPPYSSPITTLGSISARVRMSLGLDASEASHSVTCSTALQAIANGMAWLKSGMADNFICGATEAPLTGFTLAQMQALKIYTKGNKPYPCRPLELKENTMTLGEGAALFTMQYTSINQLDTQPLACIESYGYSSENPMSASGISNEGNAFYKSMKMALEESGKKPDLIIMHAPGTLKGDKAELHAINKLFGNDLPALYSNKWLCGHSLGASAALSLEAAILIFKNQYIPQMPYLEKRIQAKKKINCIMINASGFGGNAASLILSLVES
jgi:3-oxoacyl-[acyl-carrier-protein] synthase II